MNTVEVLTEKEIQFIRELRERIGDLKLPAEYLEKKNLVRWIRARSHNLEDAEKMLRDHILWRDEFNIHIVAETEEYMPPEYSDLFKVDLYGFDDDGGSIHILCGKTINLEKTVKCKLQSHATQLTLGNLEKGWNLNVKHSNGKEHIPKFVSIYDMMGISYSQCSSAEAMSFGLNLARKMDTNYPECVKRIFVVNAPWMFQIVWKVLKTILAERTTERFVILGFDKKQQRAEISKYLKLNQFPQKYGGDGEDTLKSLEELEKIYESSQPV